MEELHTTNVKTISVGDVQISGYESDYVFQCIESSRDFYEAALLREWTPLLNRPQYILDVGANLGNHTVYWATRIHPQKVISFEPLADNYLLLQKNIQQNHLDCVTAIESAVGEREGWAEVAAFHPDNYGGTSFRYTDEGMASARVCSLDHMVGQLDIPHVDFVKIDTEGFELSVLKGMKYILEKDHPALWVEAGKDTVMDVWGLLSSLDYRLAAMSAENLLFLPEEDADAPSVTWGQMLESRFTFLEKVNIYYANYEKSKTYAETLKQKLEEMQRNYQTSKDWLNQRNEELQKERDRAAAYQRDYETCKGWLAKRTKEYEDCWTLLEQREAELKKLREAGLEEQLARCLVENDRSVALLLKAGKTIQQLQAQNAYLKTENENYARKFAKITSTWYGSFGLKCYHWLQKRKWKLQALGRKLKRMRRGERT